MSGWYGRCLSGRDSINVVNGFVPHVAQELLDYWLDHPEAQGTIEAIVEWWLLEQRIQQATEQIRVALGEFVAKGFVVERPQADGRAAYRLNRDNEREIRAWLVSLAQPGAANPEGRIGSDSNQNHDGMRER